MGTPENFNGSENAEFGSAYAGLYLYAPNDYREYVQGELLNGLVAGADYEVSFYVSLAERADFAVKEFGMVFSRDKLDRPIKKMLSKMQLYKDRGNAFTFLEIVNSDFYDETSGWVRLSAEFTAAGGERFFTIGNFESNARTRVHKNSRSAKQGAYYYLDMVQVQPAGNGQMVADPGALTFSLDTEHLFRNVLFGFDEYQLRSEARGELKRLYEFLSLHPKLHITINGHTDNQGSAGYNRKLADLRCQAVAGYLRDLGLDGRRISWVAHGFEQPIADNSTEEGRQKNRRVAFSLSESTRE
jgi:outer membrane protein OmpA-like peptidoglycan-associated protein